MASEAPQDASLDKMLESMAASSAGAGPSRAGKKEVTYKEFQAMLDSTPLFMRETPEDDENNEVLQALKTLVFDGEGDETALNFKNHGNELYAQKSYKDAVTAYSQGLDAGPVDDDLRITLLNNRAQSNLFLKNYGAVLRDVGVVIALCINPPKGKRRREVPVKTMYRAAQALVALERWKEARDVVERGQEMEGQKGEKVWVELGKKVEQGWRRVYERAERTRRENGMKEALRQAVEARGLVSINTASPPDNPHPLHFDPSSLPPDPPLYVPDGSSTWTPPPAEITPLIFPVFLLYPSHQQSDLITHFNEETSLDDQLVAMFPSSPAADDGNWAPWDTKREYWGGNLVIYVETAGRRLLKVGKELTLREVLAKAVKVDPETGKKDGVVLRDGLLSFVVLVKGKQEKEWIEEFKKSRDGTKA